MAELARSRAALLGGARHVLRQARREDRFTPPSLTRVRMLGNQLRELDRLLSIWLDAVAATLDPEQGGDPAFGRMRNTPNKLRLILIRQGSETAAHLRLRAIGRISVCLHHCSGRIYDRSIHDDVAEAQGPGWITARTESRDPALLHLEPRTLIGIGLFYLEIEKSLGGSACPSLAFAVSRAA